MQDIV